MVDFWVTEEVVDKEPDLPPNVDDLLRDIDAGIHPTGDGGGTSFHPTSLDSSSQSQGGSGNEDDPNDANLQSVFADFDD
ncbi:hypothetical protein PIB30_109679 [Stylosanthes scabra]|uniref:Uncharacterized protein n=1 Tax=Stylosanthes scabra TaxID=79078 RepID=A0ABU6S0S8_9FABA|nr:hypothetical protein [Stylosanthes scabra]